MGGVVHGDFIVFQIFTEDLPEVETLPRDRVLDYLERIGKDLAIPYLVSTLSQICISYQSYLELVSLNRLTLKGDNPVK